MSSAIKDAPVKKDRRTTEQIVAVCRLSDEARECFQPGQTPNAFLSLLIQREFYLDALRFTAHKLEKRAAVWWAALCLWDQERPQPNEAADAAFQAVVDWVRDPNEGNRRAADAVGIAAGINTPVGMLGLAIYFSEGSISLPDCPEVKPEPHAMAQQVAAAVVLASKTSQNGFGNVIAAQRRFLVLAAGVEEGDLPWSIEEDAS